MESTPLKYRIDASFDSFDSFVRKVHTTDTHQAEAIIAKGETMSSAVSEVDQAHEQVVAQATENSKRYNYQRDGFQISPGPLLTETQVRDAREHAWRVLNGIYETGIAPRTNTGGVDTAKHPPYIESQMPQDADNVLHEIMSSSRMAEWAAEVTGAKRLKVFNFMVMAKYPGSSTKTVVGWHQDRRYFEKIINGRSVNVWVALDDVPVELGPLRFVPGSHRWDALYDNGFFEHDTDRQKEDIVVPEGQVWTELDSVLPAGWASAHHTHLLHGSGMNVGSKPRISMLLNYGIDEFTMVPESYFATRHDDLRATPIVYQAA
ncbi:MULTISPECIES: phytanoyl-CoA dioxygenase family protein [unclassified Sphingobium]|uniref:phytanoyl-CoA dioxygenase family protein n=1 Tax=unclassified Sphingobium TaxID=2611147 RepID=UPI0035A5A4BD